MIVSNINEEVCSRSTSRMTSLIITKSNKMLFALYKNIDGMCLPTMAHLNGPFPEWDTVHKLMEGQFGIEYHGSHYEKPEHMKQMDIKTEGVHVNEFRILQLKAMDDTLIQSKTHNRFIHRLVWVDMDIVLDILSNKIHTQDISYTTRMILDEVYSEKVKSVKRH